VGEVAVEDMGKVATSEVKECRSNLKEKEFIIISTTWIL